MICQNYKSKRTIGPEVLKKSRSVTFVTVVGITGILCNFRLVLKGQTGSEMLGSKSFRPATLPYQMQKTTPQDHRRRIAVTFVESTIRDSPEVARAKFLGVVRLLRQYGCFIEKLKIRKVGCKRMRHLTLK